MEVIDIAPVKGTISIDDLEKIDIRVGTILRVEDIPNSRSLMKLMVSFGDHERTILAGIKGEREDSGELVGKQALFVVNLEPRTMMGETSEGMLFDIGYSDGLVTPALAMPERPVPDGSRAG
jgi:tRNA-binding protein